MCRGCRMTISPIWRPLRQPEALNDEGSRWAALLGWGYRYSVRQTDDHGTDFRMTETADMVKAQVALLAVLFDGQILNAFLLQQVDRLGLDHFSVA